MQTQDTVSISHVYTPDIFYSLVACSYNMKLVRPLFDLSLKWSIMGFLICKSSSVLSLSFANFLPSSSLRWSIWTISSLTFMYLKNAAISSTLKPCKLPSLGITSGVGSTVNECKDDISKNLTLSMFIYVNNLFTYIFCLKHVKYTFL